MKIRIVTVSLFLISVLISATGNENFQIIDSRIFDPEGNEFIPKGVNVQGMKWVWPGDIVPQADKIIDAWNFNILRVNCKLYDGYWQGQNVSINAAYQTIESMQAIVDAFTPQKVVVMFEFHDFTGGYYTGDALDDLKDAYRKMADLWGDNPYVWFNIMNEPGGSGANIPTWINMHREVIEVIRDEKEANNVIVIDAHYWGQDIGEWNTNPVPEENSSILSAGNELINFNDKTYGNIMFSLHVYDQWNRGTIEQAEYRLHDYIGRVKEKGFALMIGEFGTNASEGSLYFETAFRATMKVAPAHGIGLIWWHWYGGDALKLTTTGNGNGGNINSSSNPTNLTWPGKMFWDYSNFQGNYPPFITIHQPLLNETLIEGSNLEVKMVAEDFDDGIKEVRLYKNSKLEGVYTEPPFNYNLPDVEAGRYNFKAIAVDNADNESVSTTISVNVRKSTTIGTILFITGSRKLSDSDNALFNELLGLGYNVVHKDQSEVELTDASNKIALIISSSVTNNSVGSMFLNSGVPVLIANPTFYPLMKMTGSLEGIDFGFLDEQTQGDVVSGEHPVTDNLEGIVELYAQPAGLGFGKPTTGAEILMTAVNGNPDNAILFVYPQNGSLVDMTAPAVRAGWYASADEDVLLTEQSLLIFGRLMEWLANYPVPADKINFNGDKPFDMFQNYPNPFSDHTTITYKLNTSGIATITIIDQIGAIREVLVNKFHTPGIHSVNFRPGNRYPGGIYFYRIELNNRYITKPLVIH